MCTNYPYYCTNMLTDMNTHMGETEHRDRENIETGRTLRQGEQRDKENIGIERT